MTDFEERVAFMRIALSEEEPIDPTTPFADQLNASNEEALRTYGRALPLLGSLMDAEVREVTKEVPDLDWASFLIAACSVEGMTMCHHLKSPLPMVVDLTHKRMLCHPCAAVAPKIPVDPDDDSCDFCRRTGLTQFWPSVSVMGRAMICGEACDDCVERLKIKEGQQ